MISLTCCVNNRQTIFNKRKNPNKEREKKKRSLCCIFEFSAKMGKYGKIRN